jgi:N-methylhydantoinase B
MLGSSLCEATGIDPVTKNVSQCEPGAAGYGPPARRDLERILADVLDEKITAELAEREYGVLVDCVNGRIIHNEAKPVAADRAR